MDLRPLIAEAMGRRGLSVDDVFFDYDHFAPTGCELVAELIDPLLRGGKPLDGLWVDHDHLAERPDQSIAEPHGRQRDGAAIPGRERNHDSR